MLFADDRPCGETPKEEGFASKLLKSRTLLITGTVDQEMAEKVMAQLYILESDCQDPIRVIVSSPGGHVDSGFAILDTMRFISSPIITVGTGWVASIAVPIFFGGDKGKRFSLPNTRFLLHQPMGGAGGQVADIRIEAQEILKIRQRLNKMISEETGQDIEKVAKDSDRNFWMNAEEAKKYGLISSIISSISELDKK
jgi:ATP-dependent Clp protease, protease subunit